MYPKPKKPAKLMKKSESKLMRLIDTLPFIPDAFMSRFWTTLGHTVFVPTRYDNDQDWGSEAWLREHQSTWDHENIHIVQLERSGWILHSTKYVGPSVPLFLLTLLSLFLPAVAGISWWLPASLGIATAALLPLSVGLAYGRWVIEREAYLVQMDEALANSSVSAYADYIADSLWKNYFFTWPVAWSRSWFLAEVKKRSQAAGGTAT